MKRIKLSVVGLLLSGLSYGQTTMSKCCVETINDVYKYEGMTVMSEWCKDSVLVRHELLEELFNTLDDVMSMMLEDENNGDYSHGSVEEQWGQIYWISLVADEMEKILSEHGHKIHLNK
jgi:hypothetical protein